MSSLLKAEPAAITFDAVKPGTLFVITFSVRNLSTVAQRIRLSAPKTGIFALNYIPCGAIAPGLDLRAEVECQIHPELIQDFIFTDRIVATMGNERLEIPITAIKPHAQITFDKTLKFDNVLLKQTVSKNIVLTNTSEFPGTMKVISAKGSQLRLSANKLDFAPAGEVGSIQCLAVTITGVEVGPIREIIRFQSSGSVEEVHVDVSATIVEQSLTLLSANRQGTLDIVQFDSIYFGESNTVTALMVNSGPIPLSFSLRYDDDDDDGGGASANPQSQDSGGDPYTRTMTVSPPDGIVKAFSQLEVTFTFAPTLVVPEKGFLQQRLKDFEEAKPITRSFRFECTESMQTIPVTMMAKAFIPALSISHSILRFGDCPVNDRRDIILTLSNICPHLPIHFEFPIVATFKFHPVKGRIMPHENVSIIATFLPPQLGIFKASIALDVGNGLKVYSLKVMGEASTMGGKKILITGTDKLPIDFEPHHKFVDPEEEAQARLEKRKEVERKASTVEQTLRTMLLPSTGVNGNRNGMVRLTQPQEAPKLSDFENVVLPPIIQASGESDEIYGTDKQRGEREDAMKTMKKDPTQQYLEDSFRYQQQHNQYYNDYLQQSYFKREVKQLARIKSKQRSHGAIDFSDPYGVNMGMDRGLDEPTMKIPIADEPLFMTGQQRSASSGGASGNNANANNTRKVNFGDENRLIQKKFSSTPSTQAELRDCSKELTTDELKLVMCSHKTIDFGRVNVGSVSFKSFAVMNSLHHAILVKIEDLDIELQQSRATTQIIPTDCTAGYDICFTSRVVGAIKKTFTWRINNLHSFKVTIVAEVIPIEVILSKKELIMEFPVDSIKPTLTTEVIISNPGNATADFLWGSAGAFTCDPEKGSIAAGKSSVISITWDPLSGKRNEEELGLHVTGGTDQVLVVKGLLKEVKGEFTDKRLHLGIMAVGTEKEYTTTIRNSGANELVYFLQPVDESLGLKMEPMQAFILPNESQEVKITISPRFTRSYDNISIQAKIRGGGKAISFRLAGSSIVPQVEVTPEGGNSGFAFGSVTVGSFIKLPFQLRNRSPITATLLLDLSSYEDFVPNMINVLDAPDLATQESGLVIPLQEDELGNSFTLVTNNTNREESSSSKKANSPKKSKKKKAENLWKIVLSANSVVEAELIFRPTVAKKYAYKMPINLVGMIEDRSLQRDITAVAIQSVLRITQPIVDFHDRVVSRDPLSRVSYFLETTIVNQSNTGVSFVIREGNETARNFDGSMVDSSSSIAAVSTAEHKDGDEAAEKAQIFFVSPLTIDLAPGASTKIRVTFQPQSNVMYVKKLGLFRKDPTTIGTPMTTTAAMTPKGSATTLEDRPYLTILCVGSGVFPCMAFSDTQVRLPTVPHNVTSRVAFTIFNNGYAALEVKHRISPTIPIPLDISYPDGNQLGIMIDKIRVIVSVKSSLSTSFSGKLEFYDTDGERFFINLLGCIDNCLLTNYPFVHEYAQAEYGFIGIDDAPVQFLPTREIAELRLQESRRKEEQRRQRSLERQRLVEGGGNTNKNDSDTQHNKRSVKIADAYSDSPPSSPKRSKSVLSRKNSSINNKSNFSDDTPVDIPEGVDLEKTLSNSPMSTFTQVEELEFQFLLNWLNKTVCYRRRFDLEKYPLCVVDSQGDIVVDCLELMSGKKIPNLVNKDASNTNSRNIRNNNNKSNNLDEAAKRPSQTSEKSKLLAHAEKLLFKLQSIVNFLLANGALLAHVPVLALLPLNEYLLMQEVDFCKDKSIHITPSILTQSREKWHENWSFSFQSAWLEVVLQAVKIFVLARLNYKDYSTLPGVVLPSSTLLTRQQQPGINDKINKNEKKGGDKNNETAGKDGKTKQKGEKSSSTYYDQHKKYELSVPKDLRPSNVFTHSEAVLLAWLSYHLEHAENTCVDSAQNNQRKSDATTSFLQPLKNKRIVDLEVTFRHDFLPYCQLLHSHVPEIASEGEPLRGYTVIESRLPTRQEELYAMFVDACHHYHCGLETTAEAICASSRTILLTLLHLYLTLPTLIPQAKVEFTGILGEPITKKIELRNSAFATFKKPLCYSVSLRGEKDDFSLEKTRLLVESENEFLVTLNARFQREQHCKIYFHGVKEPTFAPAQTLCFELITRIIGVKAIETIERENASLYEMQVFSLSLKNVFSQDVNCKVKLDVKFAGKTIQDIVKRMKQTLPAPPSPPQRGGKKTEEKFELLTSPAVSSTDNNNNNNGGEQKVQNDDFELEQMLKQPFWTTEDTVQLPSSTSSSGKNNNNNNNNNSRLFNVNFLPFLLGKYICTVSFFDPNVGEFCYRIVAEVTLPKATEKLEISVQQGNSSQLGVTCNSKNASYDKACAVLTEMRIKNAGKKIRAKSIFASFAATQVDIDDASNNNNNNNNNCCGVFGVDFTSNFFNARKTLSFVSDYLVTNTNTNAAAANNNNNNNNNNFGNFNSNAGSKSKKVAKSQLELLPPPEGGGDESSNARNNNNDFESGNNKLLLLFNPQRAGSYRTTMVLYPLDNPKADIRCIDLTCVAKVPDAKMIIEFFSPARQLLTQDIPITNETDEDWFLSLSTTGRGFNLAMPGEKTLPVPAKNTATIKVEFFAANAGNYDGKLLVRNVKDSFEYSLSGVAEEPLAEESLSYSCTARKKSTFAVTLPTLNSLFRYATKKSSFFTVETDLPYVSCDDKIELSGSEKVSFSFAVTCPVSGPLLGYLAFKEVTNDNHGHDLQQQVMFWYSIEINVRPAEEERVIPVTTLTRSAVAVDITLINPLDEPLLFFVSMAGEGLIGAKEFLLPAKNSTASNSSSGSTYEVIFAPLLAGDFTGRVTFSNTLVGELWYKLELHARPAPPVLLPTVEAMLGDETTVDTAVLENPTNETATYTATLSQGDHGFTFPPLTGNQVVIGPYSESRCLLLFRPKALGENSTLAMLTVSHPKLGEMRFEIRGIGLLPGVMKQVVIDAPLEEISSQSIVFRNPFPRPLAIDISLDTTGTASTVGTEEVFSLVVRRQANPGAGISVTVAANGTYPIPVAFRPPVMGVFEARLNVRSLGGGIGGDRERELLWCYPLQGTAEVGQVHRLPTIAAPAKTSVVREAFIPLTGLSGSVVKVTDFVVALDMEETAKKLVQRSFQLQLLEVVTQPNQQQQLAIRCRLIFEPLRVFSSRVNIALTHRTKGKWRAKVDLDAQDPSSPDDTIKLAASVGQTDRVTFKLSNRFLGFSPFQAFFTSNSSPHFTVEPQNGVLPPYGGELADSEKVAFTVTFAPKEYGYIEQGTLSILTEDAQWTYSIKGSYPEHGIGSSNRARK